MRRVVVKKILHISKYFYPFRGGTEQIAQDCIEALKGKYEQKVICFNHEQGNIIEMLDGIEIIRCGCLVKIASQSISLSYGPTLRKVIKEFRPDAIIFHYPNPFVAHYLLKYCKKNIKLVIYWHLDIVKQRFLRKLFYVQNMHLVKRADKIIATSPTYVKGSKWLSEAVEKCVVVPNCINEERLQINDEIIKKVEQIRKENESKIICMAVGRHTEYKGFSYLVEASKLLDSRFKIFITGQGELTEELKEKAQGDEKIVFLGLISDDELKAYLNAMDIFCFPSITKNEAFGLALAEAMYYEKPAITFTIKGSGVNYVSLNGETGIQVPNRNVVEYANAIKELGDNVELRKQYGVNAKRRVVDNFLLEQYAKNVRREMDNIFIK